MLKKRFPRFIKSLFIFCFLSSASGSYAYTIEDPNHWVIQIAPYLWAMNMDGDVGVANRTVHIDQSFSDILNQFDGGGMLWLDARYDKVDLFLNSLYTVLSDHKSIRRIDASSRNEFGLFTAGFAYRVFEIPNQFQFEPYVGARYTINNTEVEIDRFKTTDDQSWSNPLVGARLNFIFNQNWLAMVAGDVGGVSSTDWSYNTNAFLGYTPTRIQDLTLYLGYRLLHQRYETGFGLRHYTWNMNMFGPVAGLGLRF